MANDKSVRRYRVLNRCFRDTSRDYTLLDLLDEVNKDQSELSDPHPVSERQLYSDIAYMRSVDGLNAEIDTYKVVRPDEKGHNRPYVAYRYHDPSFSIDNLPLTGKQLNYVRSALNSLKFITGIPQVAWLQQSFVGVQQYFENYTKPCIQFSGNPFLGGSRANEVYQFFEQIFTAITNKQALTINYRCFKRGDCSFRFHPIYFKQFRGFWYVYGATTEDPETIRTLALDRMLSVGPCDDSYIAVDFDPESYFEDIVGVINVPGEPVDVHLQFFGWATNYVENCPLHGSQRSKWIDVDGQKVLDVWLKLKINSEFVGDLQYYVDCVKVISPESLRLSHIEHIRSAMALNGIE